MGKESGGRVFTFENRDDLGIMRDYYENIQKMPLLDPDLSSHLYQDGNVLLQINGELPKEDADRYAAVL